MKLSFSCMPNIGKTITSHNKRQKMPTPDVPPCRCTLEECPLNGNCEKSNVIYQCTITEEASGKKESYVGLTANSIKDRITKHRKSFRDRTYHRNSLSRHVWKLKDQNKAFQVAWKILDQATTYSPSSKLCNLCTRETYFILFKKNLATLNRKDEFFGYCLHKRKYFMENQ